MTFYNGNQILSTAFPAPRWIVPGIIPEGLSFLAAKPKMGKSILVLGLLRARALADMAFDSIKLEKDISVYVSFEDGPRRHQERLGRMSGGMPENLANLIVYYDFPKMGSGGLAGIKKLFETTGCVFYVVDTFQIFRPPSKTGQYSYADDYAHVNKLMVFARDLGISILFIHHLRKKEADDVMDTLNGSTGIGGGCDNILVLERKSAVSMEGILHVTGKDVESAKHKLKFDKKNFHWNLVKSESKEVLDKTTQTQAKILFAMRNKGQLSPTQITDISGVNHGTVKKLLRRMEDEGKIVNPAFGLYEAIP